MTSKAALISKRENLHSLLQAINDSVKSCSVNEIDVATVKRSRVESLVADYHHLLDEIIIFNSQVTDKKDAVKYETERNSFFDVVDNIELHYLRLRNRVASSSQPAVSATSTSASASASTPTGPKLKAINIPNFSGKISEWNEFKSLFDSVVNKSALPDVQKFQHLRSSLSDCASKLIAHLELSDANYDIAYKLLCDRYESPRLHCNYHINNLLSYNVAPLTSHANLQKYFSTHCSSIQAFNTVNVNDKLDYVLFHICYSHFDQQTQADFDKLFPVTKIPTYDDLFKFVSDKLKNSELHSTSSSDQGRKDDGKKSRNSFHVGSDGKSKDVKKSCPMCNGSHYLSRCQEFQSVDIPKRYDFLKNKSLCFNCFGNHNRSNCKSTYVCKVCQGKHNSMLHIYKQPGPSGPAPNMSSTSDDNSAVAMESAQSCHVKSSSTRHAVLLGTARGYVKASNGKYVNVRILLDSASEVSFITASCVDKLGLTVRKTNLVISGISQCQAEEPLGKVDCCISPTVDGKAYLKCEATVMRAISSKLPTTAIDPSSANRFIGFKLADPRYFEPQDIDFMIGASLYPDVLLDRPPVRGKPSGIFTIFGLVIVGEAPSLVDAYEKCTHHVKVCSMLTLGNSVEAALTRFWQSEEVADAPRKNPEDEYCEKFFVETTKRTADGRYVVKLPFVEKSLPVGTNRHEAERRFLALERRLTSNDNLKKDYCEFLKEYEDLGHMELAKTPANYVIPHHAVHKSSSSTTKTRVVFDGSAKDSMSVSLNDRLLKGPKLTKDISHVLCGFRLYVIPLTADLKMMYRQVLVAPEDRIHQHIFWRKPGEGKILEYELNTVTYGLAPSAYLSQRALRQLVIDEGHKYPLAAAVLLEQCYVDDVCGGAGSEEESVLLYEELHQLLSKAGFFPRKWSSSSEYVLSKIPDEHCEKPMLIREEGDVAIKVLGLEWNPKRDSFSYSIQPFAGDVTKRTILSYVAKIFDPLGFLTPCVFRAKCFLQQLWLCGVDWDDLLPQELRNEWNSFVSTLCHVSHVSVPRYVPALGISDLWVIGFCDASSKGYGAVIYLRCVKNGTVTVSLLVAKSKVAPLKPTSIPRLELNACLLLSRMIKSAKPFLDGLPAYNVRLYSDSSVALAWIHTPPHKLKCYVGNRVVEITDVAVPSVWRHVPTHLNIADCASRGLSGSDLATHSIWWQGPPFLLLPRQEWPNNVDVCEQHLIPELREPEPDPTEIEISLLCRIFEPTVAESIDFIGSVSSFNRLIRVIAYVLRFFKLCKKIKPRHPYLSIPELRDAESRCVKLTQQHFFSSQIEMVKSKRGHLTNLKALAPFIDSLGFLRVGGRLVNSDLHFSAKHPLLIPSESNFAKLICKFYHRFMLHAGPQAMRAQIQLKYWIPGIGRMLRTVVSKCERCFRFKVSPIEPPMADLPASRFSQVRAFLNVGVDYAGPVLVRESKRRKSPTYKTWICVFVCLSTKAIHLDVVSDLTTDAFLAVFDRLVSRRGLCQRLQSDCATTFTCGARNLREVWEFLLKNNDKIGENLAHRRVEWVFSPPAAPHFNGITEAAVKSMKHHLIRTVGTNVLTFEELSTYLCRIEAVCNSRPLCPLIAKDPNDETEFLSPGHFLIGSSMLAVPELPFVDVKINRLSRWQLITQSVQHFWKLWSTAYLQSLMPRNKWTKPAAPLQVNDIVLVKGMASSPLNWPIGKIIALLPGKDGIARVAQLQVRGARFTRPLVSLVRLPMD